MKRPAFAHTLPSKERERGQYRRHERERALASRYRRIAGLRYADPAHVHVYRDERDRYPYGHADWALVFARRRRDARGQLDTRSPCSCMGCGNQRRYVGITRAERCARIDLEEALMDIRSA